MNKTEITILLCPAIIILGVFLLSCEKNYITQAPEEHVPEYHMTYCYVSNGDYEPKYIITINTNTREVIDSITYNEMQFRDIQFLDGGNKAFLTGYPDTFIEDVITRDTVSLIDEYYYSLLISSNERFCAVTKSKIYLLSLPDLILIDSVNNDYLIPIGIDDSRMIFYTYYFDTSLIYAIDFSVSPSETTIVDIVDWRPNPNRKISALLSPDNKTLLINSEEEFRSFILFEYSTDSLSYVTEIPGKKLYSPVWTKDCKICYGTNDGSVVKYNTQTKIYSTIIDKNNISTPDYHWDSGEGFYASYLQLTPNDKHLYIQLPPNCGGPCIGVGGQTLVYDLNTKEFIYRYDYSEYSAIGWGLMRINPKDWSN